MWASGWQPAVVCPKLQKVVQNAHPLPAEQPGDDPENIMASVIPNTAGDLQTALQHAVALLQQDPAMAAEQAREVLEVYPEAEAAQQVLGTAWRLQGDPRRAIAILEPLAKRHPESADVLHEFGLALGAAGRGDDAIEVLEQALEAHPEHSGAWRTLGDQLSAAGAAAAAEEAFERHLALSTRHPQVVEAVAFFRKGNLAKAEQLTRDVLKQDPLDIVAIRLLASIGVKLGQLEDAKHLLERCLELAPGFHLARHGYTVVLFRRHELDAALEQVEKLLRAEPANPNYLILKGTILVRRGEHRPALEIYARILADYPRHAGAHLNYGHTLKTVGRLDDAIAAYRASIELSPGGGEAYWSLANLKTFRFTDADIERMRAELAGKSSDPEDEAHLAFALAKALEDRGEYDASFACYKRGNDVRGRHHRWDAKINVFNTARQMKALDGEFFAAREGWGCSASDPIFIVGLPRAGSTLLEQILASHSRVEGTAELPDIIAISRRLGQKTRRNPASKYPEVLKELTPEAARELGEGYLESTRVQRSGKPFFIDKMPNNFQHVGLIHLILPNAKIIDARRHPMGGCFSCYKQLFARGQNFTYDLDKLGRYYRDYVILMDHWEAVLPGRVHRVQYEDIVESTEAEVRCLLAYCGLEFEEQCLRFFETERAIRTPSAEQVRQPVYREGLEHWRHYERHLGPLQQALGTALERYANK
jgi:tetratricopeptide (TPR) repeat protein